MKHFETFEAALAAATADVTEMTAAQRAKMADHWAMVSAWNQRINLMGDVSCTEAAYLHYRDALELLPFLTPGPLLDVGSGGGFPGMPLAIVRPSMPITLMEPRQKRASLLHTAAARLKLSQVSVLTTRLEHAPQGLFDQVVTRATFSDLTQLAAARHWMAPNAKLIALRSAQSTLPQEAIDHLREAGLSFTQSHTYRLEDHTRRLDVWTLSSDPRHKEGSRSK